jgi:hypothetical protein
MKKDTNKTEHQHNDMIFVWDYNILIENKQKQNNKAQFITNSKLKNEIEKTKALF